MVQGTEELKMHFTKMEGIGNDYVYVDCTKEQLKNPEAAARYVSRRHFGIGSDGLILIRASERADFEMEMYNADGSRGKMCGNGIRCVGKYVYDHGLTDKKQITVDTLSGIKELDMETGPDGKISTVTVDMGIPVLLPEHIPVDLPGEAVIGKEAEIGGRRYKITCISMGNPHCVIFMEEDVRELNLPEIGPKFENAALFPEGVNTEFVNVEDGGTLRMRVWERGSGETLACGTGACAAACAGVLTGQTKRQAEVLLTGGAIRINWSEEDGHVYMTGPAREVFEGDIDVQDQ